MKAYLIITLLLLVTLYSCTSGPESVANKFLQAKEKTDFKMMKELSTAESQNTIGMFEVLNKANPQLPMQHKLTIKSSENVTDSTALYTYCCDEAGNDNKLYMRKTPEGWRVDVTMGGKNLLDFFNADSLRKMSTGQDIPSHGHGVDTVGH